MSRTRKDSKQITNTVLEVVKRHDGMFDLFLNRKLDHNFLSETRLAEELCVRFGFCGEECHSILRDVNQDGRKTVAL